MEVQKTIRRWIGKANVYMILVLFPFILTDKLNNVTRTRYLFFIATTFFFFALMVINEICYYLRFPKERRYIIWRGSDGIVIFLFLVSLISYILSPYKKYALSGAGTRYIGLIFMIAVCCMYITISRCYIFSEGDLIAALITATAVHLIAVMHYVGVDPFGFFVNVPKQYVPVYISTMGNVDIYGMYASVTASVAAYAYITMQNNKKRWFYLLAAFMGMSGVLVCDSDMAFLGLMVFFILVFPLVLKTTDLLAGYFTMFALWLLSGRFAGCLYILFPHKTRILEGIATFFIYRNESLYLLAAVMALLLAIILFSKQITRVFTEKRVCFIRNGYIVLLAGAVFVGIILIGYVSMTKSNVEFLPENIFRIDDKWGSNRGYIWKYLLEGYGHMPWYYKIFGTGEGTVANILSYYTEIHWNRLAGGVIDNAHNIWLQFLVTQGVAGLSAYVLLVANFVRRTVYRFRLMDKGLDNSEYNTLLIGIGLAALVYVIQGSCCLLETITFPIFICLAAMVNGKMME